MNCDLRGRAPTVTLLPDDRERVTRVYDVLNNLVKNPTDILASVWLAWGTTDETFTSCRLIQQFVTGQPETFPDGSKRPPVLTRVYEELSATAETQVGEPTVTVNQYGYREVEYNYLQLSVGTATLLIPGTSAAPSPYGTLILREQRTEDNGAVRSIKRIYVEGGQLDQVDNLKFGGKVLIRRLKYLNEVPPTPAGFTLVEHTIYFINGLPVYDYGYASGDPTAGGGGLISQDDRYAQSSDQGTTGVTIRTIRYIVETDGTVLPTTQTGFILISKSYTDEAGYRVWTTVWAKGTGEVSREVDYGQSTDEGTTGITKTTIRYLSVSTQATRLPAVLAGSVCVGETHTEEDGYRLWTTVWAKGAGTILTTTETKNNGKLYLQTIRALGAAPSTPAGYTAISATIQEGDGYKIYVNQYAKGDGEISRETDTKNNGMLYLRTIRYVTVPAAVEPTPTDISGYTQTSSAKSEQDGHMIWTLSYAKGVGEISCDTATKNNGMLYLRNIRYITAPSASQPTPTTDVTGYELIDVSKSEQDGHMIWGLNYAKGVGEVSREIDWSQGATSTDETLGVTKTTIRYIVAKDGTVEPTTLAGSVMIGKTLQELDGHRIWITVWAKGAGLVITTNDKKYGGGTDTPNLVIYRRVQLGSAPTAPDATISGTVVATGTTMREDSGYKVYDYTWAEGLGEISRDVSYSQSLDQGSTIGATITTIKYLVAPGATVQPVTEAGSIKVGEDYQDGDGYRTWTTKWAKGTGLVSQTIHARQDGLREVTNIALGTKSTPTGVVIRDDYRIEDGYTVYIVTAIQSASGGAVTSAAVAFQRYVPFLYPGRAKAYKLTAQNGWVAYDVFLSPPVKTDVNATIAVSYQTSDTLGALTYTYWNPKSWAVIYAEWVGLNNEPGFLIKALPGYRSISETALSFTEGIWEDDMKGTMIGNVVYGDTTAKLQVTGGPAAPDTNTYTLDATLEPAFTSTDGTIYYRKTIVTSTIPAQDALPV